MKAAVEAAANALTDAGAKIERVSVPSTMYGLSAYYLIAPAEASSNLARYDGVRAMGCGAEARHQRMNAKRARRVSGAEVKRRIMLGTYVVGRATTTYYGQAATGRRPALIIRDFERAYEQFDVLLSPTSPTVAFELGAKTADPLTMYLNDVCTIPSNLAGHAAMSVPFGTALAMGAPTGAARVADRCAGARCPRSRGRAPR